MRHVGRAAVAVALSMTLLGGTGLGLRMWANRHSDMVRIPGISFRMGSTDTEATAAFKACLGQDPDAAKRCSLEVFRREEPARWVQVSSYRIDTTEVTIERFAAWLSEQQGLRTDPDEKNGEERWVRDGKIDLVDLWPSYRPPFGMVHEPGRYRAVPGFEKRPMTHVSWDAAERYYRCRYIRRRAVKQCR